jgi:hypothetical protein
LAWSVRLIERVEKLSTTVYHYSPRRYENVTTGVVSIRYHNVALAAYLREKATELNDHIGTLPRACQREYLRAFFDDEGCMDVRLDRYVRRIRGYQNNRKILQLVRSLLANFNITAVVRGRNEIVIFGRDNLIGFQREINFSKGVRVNPNRSNSLWKRNMEKRTLLQIAIDSFNAENLDRQVHRKGAGPGNEERERDAEHEERLATARERGVLAAPVEEA